MGIVKEKTLSAKKLPVEISCTGCDTEFRLWIPEDMVSDWEGGATVRCIKCGARQRIEKGDEGLYSRSEAGEEAAVPRGKVADEPEAAASGGVEPVQEQEQAEAAAGDMDTVLLIEDDKLSRRQAEDTIKDAGIRFITVKDSAEALDILKKNTINLIVTDLYLKKPGDPPSMLDGEDLLKKIADSGVSIPSIIITGKDLLDEMILDPKWFDLHVKAFIQKGNPFWADDLKLKIKEILYKD